MLKHFEKAPLPSSSKSNGRHAFTRQQLLKHLALLNTMPSPLPPTLPSSPPASRSASPAPAPSGHSVKRKSEPSLDNDRLKRPRTDSSASTHRVSYPPPTHSHHSSRSELAEDGELSEEPALSSHAVPPRPTPVHSAADPSGSSFVPIRRPKRGQYSLQAFSALHDKYHHAGRKLKYSGDARFWSTYPPSHKEYRPIANAPPPNSLYHIHGGLIAKLELMEALIMFVYASWCKEYGRGGCNSEAWLTMDAFIKWCKTKWSPEEGSSDAEKAFYGLILMLNAFIHARIVAHGQRRLHADVERVSEATRVAVSSAIDAASRPSATLLGAKPQSTPPMLPSPASIGATSSRNSTPTNRDGTPISSDSRSASSLPTAINASLPSGPPIPPRYLPSEYRVGHPPPHIAAAADSVHATMTLQQLGSLNETSHSLNMAILEMQQAQVYLNFSSVAKHFPRTFSRMVHSTLKFTEEHEVDFEDDDGELFWPGQSITGEGLGWLCYMGEAMVREFGKQYQFIGLKGVVPKPDQSHYDQNRPRPGPPGTASREGQR